MISDIGSPTGNGLEAELNKANSDGKLIAVNGISSKSVKICMMS